MVACLTLLLRDLGMQQPVFQILAYPLTDVWDRWPSYVERGSGYILDREFILWSTGNYMHDGQNLEDPYLFPLNAADLSELAPMLIVTAEFDPLRDEGIAYAQRVAAAGVAVEHIHAADQMHGFLLLDRAVAKAGTLIDGLADVLAGQVSGTAGKIAVHRSTYDSPPTVAPFTRSLAGGTRVEKP